MNIKLPENGDKILFEDNDVQIIIGIDKPDTYRLNLYVKDHDKYSDIIPNDGEECNHHKGINDSYSTVSDLPNRYSSLYLKVYNYILSEFNVYRVNNSDLFN